MTRGLALLCLLSATSGCRPKVREKPAPPSARKGQKRAHETVLYVDGAPRASMSLAELPSGGGHLALCEYLNLLGVDCASLGGVHLYGEGGAITPLKDPAHARLEIDAGSPPRVDGAEVTAITVYVKKPVPPLPLQGIPYLDEPVRGGTRVNVDGRLAARIKRNQIEGSLPELGDDDGEPRYALADFLQRQKLGTARAIELVTAEDLVVRVPDAEVGNVSFAAEREKHGQMSFRFAGRAVSTVAVNVYVALAPPAREVSTERPATRQAGFTAGCDFTGAVSTAPLGLILVGFALLLYRRLSW